MILASMLFWGLLLDGELSLIDGVVLLSLLFGYLTFSYISSKNSKNEEEIEAGPNNPLLSGLFILVGISMLVGGGILFVNGAVDLAKTFGVSEVIIGLTIVAIGTSMPELVTSVIAALKGQSDIAIGNVVGSNLFNILGILGVTAIVHPVSSLGFQPFDFMVMLALAIVILPFAWTGLRIGRREGSVLLLTYLGYMGYLINQASAQALV